MSLKWNGKSVRRIALKCVSYIVKKTFAIILWIFLIVIFIVLAISQGFWQAAGFALIIAIIYAIRFLRLKLKHEKQLQKASQSSVPSTPLS